MESGRESKIISMVVVAGRAVQRGWKQEAEQMPNPPASWLKEYSQVSPAMQRTDRNIGVHVILDLLRYKDTSNLSDEEFVELMRGVVKRGKEKL